MVETDINRVLSIINTSLIHKRGRVAKPACRQAGAWGEFRRLKLSRIRLKVRGCLLMM